MTSSPIRLRCRPKAVLDWIFNFYTTRHIPFSESEQRQADANYQRDLQKYEKAVIKYQDDLATYKTKYREFLESELTKLEGTTNG